MDLATGETLVLWSARRWLAFTRGELARGYGLV